ncbi:hypothetical protein GCM10029964_077730 [Kibdelosporangium lantanae]
MDVPVRFTGEVVGTEKVDGTNARIISLPGGMYLIGSREELLHARGDLIANPAQGIVKALRAVADALPVVTDDVIRVHYLEVYGHKIGKAAPQYTGAQGVDARLFDVAVFDDHAEQLTWSAQRISTWREDGNQPFVSEKDLAATAADHGLTLTPRLFTIDAAELPTEIGKTSSWLAERLPRTHSAIDDTAGGEPEGIVLRTTDRSVIAKARFQDYKRTLTRRRR